jgi:transcriptional regulator with XRE-family HTH domain
MISMDFAKKQTSEIMDALRGICRAQNITQVQISDYLGVSLPTVKRWFAGHGVSLDVFNQLLELTGTSLEDLSNFVTELTTNSFEYTIEQEQFFSEHLNHLAYFDQLLNGYSPKMIQRRYKLSDHSTRRYLKDLEELGLIDRYPNNKVKIVPKGSPKWHPDGPLDEKVGRLALNSFIEKAGSEFVTLHLHRYGSHDRSRIESLLAELSTFAKQANRRAKFSGIKDRAFGLLVGLANFELQALKEIKNL